MSSNRMLIGTFAIFGLIIIAILLLAYFRLTADFTPIHGKVFAVEPQQVKVGGIIKLRREVCSNSQQRLEESLNFYAELQPVNLQSPPQAAGLGAQRRILYKGCQTTEFSINLPTAGEIIQPQNVPSVGVTPGTYKVVGTGVVAQTGSFQVFDFESEAFEVVP